jgi:hypothetical protein
MGYPAEMPFIPNTNMSLTNGSEGNVMAVWETSDAEKLFEDLTSEVSANGWAAQPDNPMFAHLPGGLRMRAAQAGRAYAASSCGWSRKARASSRCSTAELRARC